jgi:hypothetical protein
MVALIERTFMIRIKSSQDGFRRCGIAHSAEVTEHEDNAFTEEQMEILKAEPVLLVEVVEVVEEEKNKSTKTAK